MKTIILSGWGQPEDALSIVAPGATPIGYAHHDSVEDALVEITDEKPDIVIGWSLGGQLAARAISAGLIAPKKLVLIAAPYEFVEVSKSGLGMKRDTFDKFFDNYAQNPMRTLSKAWELVALYDDHAALVRSQLAHFSRDTVIMGNWLKWLSLIDGFSCDVLDFDKFPPTLLVHGEEDVVVEAKQSQRFADRIPHAKLDLWPGCGHAPHWHDTERLKFLIEEHSLV